MDHTAHNADPGDQVAGQTALSNPGRFPACLNDRTPPSEIPFVLVCRRLVAGKARRILLRYCRGRNLVRILHTN